MRHLTRIACALLLAGAAGCTAGNEDCSAQTCDQFGGSADRKLESCVVYPSIPDDPAELLLKDDTGEELFRCTSVGPAPNECQNSFGAARDAYCAQ
jgi:hypothetical protein